MLRKMLKGKRNCQPRLRSEDKAFLKLEYKATRSECTKMCSIHISGQILCLKSNPIFISFRQRNTSPLHLYSLMPLDVCIAYTTCRAHAFYFISQRARQKHELLTDRKCLNSCSYLPQ